MLLQAVIIHSGEGNSVSVTKQKPEKEAGWAIFSVSVLKSSRFLFGMRILTYPASDHFFWSPRSTITSSFFSVFLCPLVFFMIIFLFTTLKIKCWNSNPFHGHRKVRTSSQNDITVTLLLYSVSITQSIAVIGEQTQDWIYIQQGRKKKNIRDKILL